MLDSKYTLLHVGSRMQTERWTCHAYPSSMYGDTLERPISILVDVGDDIQTLELSRDEARALAMALLAGAAVA